MTMPATIEETDIAEAVNALFREADLWAVIVHNDDVTTFEQVIYALVDLFDHTVDSATELANTVHLTGKAVAAVLSEDEAKRGVTGLHDRHIQASMEKA